VVFKVADSIGRKRELQIGSCMYFLGAVLMFAGGYFSVSPSFDVAVLIFARIIYGIGIGFSMHGAPTYIAEMAPPNLRGLLVSLKEAFIVVGILGGYVVGYLLENQKGGWRYGLVPDSRSRSTLFCHSPLFSPPPPPSRFMYGASSFFSLVMFFGTFTIPRSARWLLLAGKPEEEVMASINFLFKGNDTVELYDEIKFQVDKQKADQALALQSGDTSRTNIFSARWRGPLIAGTGLVLLQQVTGQPSILSYTQPIFEDAGLASYSSVLVGVFKFFATMFSVLYVEKYGR
jgi:MFS family permease